MRQRAKTTLLIVGVAAGSIVPLLVVLATGRTLVWRDTARISGPIRTLIVEALRSGSVPSWNPHEAIGQPVFGQLIHGVLHPVSVALALLAPGSGAEGMIVAYVAAAAGGASVLVLALRGSAAAAAAAGVAYAWSGYVLGMTSNVVFLAAGATAPWTVAGLRAAASGGDRGWVLGALGVAALHLAGDPQWTVAAVVVGALLGHDAQRWAGVRRVAGATVLGTGLAAMQLVPAWFAFADTVRTAGLTAADRVQWALSPWRIPELVLPGFFGAPTEDEAIFLWLGGPTQATRLIPFTPSVAVGATTLVLAGAGTVASRTGRTLAGAALVLLWVALGTFAGADQVLRHVPIWGSFRYAEKLVGPLTLCLVVLAAMGLEAVTQRTIQPRGKWILVTGIAALVGALVLSSGWMDGAAPGVAAWPLAAARLGRGVAHAGAALVALGVVLSAAGRAGWRQWAAPAIAAIGGAAALAAAPFAVNIRSPATIDTSWLEQLRGRDGPVRIATPGTDVYRVPIDLGPTNGTEAALSRHGVPPFTTAIRVDNVYAYEGLPQRRWLAFHRVVSARPDLHWRAWRRLGLTHVVQKAPDTREEAVFFDMAASGGRLAAANPDWWLTAWEVPHRPWAHVARSVRLATGEDEARAILGDVLASGSEDVVLEAPTNPPLGAGRVLSAERVPDEVRVDVEMHEPGLLVVAESYARGWTATVGGQPVPIWPADAIARAVPVPAGRHRVVLRYTPPGLAAGVAVSALSLAAVAVLIALKRRRPRDGSSHHPGPRG